MKSMLAILAVLFSFQTFAGDEAKVCEKLLVEAQASCDEAMCEDAVSEGYECERDGDFYEGFTICVYDGELPELVKAYNKKHPRAKVSCEDL